jgi:hypothetical protein
VLRKDLSYQHESEVRLLIWDPEVGTPTAGVHVTYVANDIADTLANRSWNYSTMEMRQICEEAVIASTERQALESAPQGFGVRVDINALIEELVVAPDQPDWVADLVRDVLRKYDLRVTVRHSHMKL